MSNRKAKVLVIYNQPVLPPNHPHAASEHDILETSESVTHILGELGYNAEAFGFARDPRLLIDKVAQAKPDLIFNLFEGEADRPGTEISCAALLEWLDIPFTGAPSWAMALGRDKIRAKRIFQGCGLPTARFMIVDHAPVPHWEFNYPAIVKPSNQDASVGIDQKAVVENQVDLRARVTWVLEQFGGPVLVEEFVNGREFHVNMYEVPGPGPAMQRLKVIPLSEITFAPPQGQSLWPIYSFEAKWNEHSVEYKSAPLKTGLILPGSQMEVIERVCKEAYRMIGLRDYGRVDIRLSDDNIPYILEVNPNPYLDSLFLVEGFAAMGRHYNDLLNEIVQNTLLRVTK
jgi:D-alanine-D-alanine ligase